MKATTQTKRELAIGLLLRLFEHRERVAIAEVLAAGEEIGVSRRTLQRAAGELGIREVHNGPHGAFWEWPLDHRRANCSSH